MLIACDPVPPFYEVPWVPFDPIEVNINLPGYSKIRVDGGAVEVPGGVRGIILYRENASSYYAYERNCTYLPNEACATVDIDPSGLYMLDTCCGSSFSYPFGNPIGGPAIYALQRYRTVVNGTIITITDEIVN